MNPSVRVAATALVTAALLLTACTSVAPATDAPSLDGTAWVLSSLPGRTLVPGEKPTLRFDGGRASGTDGCNRYTTSYTSTGGTLKFDAAGYEAIGTRSYGDAREAMKLWAMGTPVQLCILFGF